jgi:L-alanine-DL-glutamate epimerase-like enolase superfamily enzyme
MADLDSHFDFDEDPISGGLQVAKGLVTLPEGPGLGADIDPSFLRKLERVR